MAPSQLTTAEKAAILTNCERNTDPLTAAALQLVARDVAARALSQPNGPVTVLSRDWENLVDLLYQQLIEKERHPSKLVA